MADDQLSTEPGRFEYYKNKLEEEKANQPQLSTLPPNIVDIAMTKARSFEFPPMGIVNFSDVPNNKETEQILSKKAENIIKGTVVNISELEQQSPRYLKSWGISNLPLFEESEANKALTTKTQTSFNTILDEIFEIEDGGEPEFDNELMKKLSAKDLYNLLDSTILEFLKEIGLDRTQSDVKQRDDLILESSQKIFDFLTRESNPGIQTEDIQPEPAAINIEEGAVGISEEETIDPVPVSPVQPLQTQNEIPNAITPTQQNNTTIIQSAQQPVQRATPIFPANSGQTSTTASANNIVTPAAINQSSGFAGEQEFTGETGTSAISSGGTPLLDILAASSGMSTEEIAKMFQAQDGSDNLTGTLDLSLAGTPEINQLENIETQTTAQTVARMVENNQGIQPAAVVSEPAKMIEALSEPAQTQTQLQPSPQEKINSPEMGGEFPPASPTETVEKITGQETTKTEENSDIEPDSTNAEILKVMKDVLKTLQGPLIVTDGKHYFS